MILVFVGISVVSASDVNQTTALNSESSHLVTATTAGADNISNGISKDTGYVNNNYSQSEPTKSKKTLSLNNTKTVKSVKQSTENSITKDTSKIVASNKTVTDDSKVELVATVVNKNTGKYVDGGNVLFKINGKTLGYANLNNGKAYYRYDITNLSPKTYTINTVFGGTSTLTGSRDTGYLKITEHQTEMTVTNKKIAYGENIKLVATVVDKSTGKYATGGNIAFKINGKTIGYSALVNGKAYYIYDAKSLKPKTYSITATYSGIHLINGNKANGYLKVIKQNTVMTVSDKTIRAGNPVKLVATVVNKKTGKYITGGKVVFKINGKTVGHGTLSNGKAYYTYNSQTLDIKSYVLTAKFSGSDLYEESSAKQGKLVVIRNSFTYSQIKEAAVNLRNQLESDHKVTSVTVESTTMGLQDFLPLMIHTIKNVNNGKSSSTVDYQHYTSISSQTDTMETGQFKKAEMIKIGSEVLHNYQIHNKPLTYISTRLGKLGYYNMIYLYSKMIDVSTSRYLPETCKVYNWNTIHPIKATSRVIYITSDNIHNTAKDKAYMNTVKSILKSKGFTVYTMGIGPNKHNEAIWLKKLPSNAVQLSIFGGADAGVIYDVCTRSFMRTKENRLIFFAYRPPAVKITGLTWLSRAHDDNYSPSSFKGIAYPDKYLTSHGYGYVYTDNAYTIVNNLIKYINS